jgi:ribosome-associated protein
MVGSMISKVTTLTRTAARAANPAPVSPESTASAGSSEGLLTTILHVLDDAKAEETVKIDLVGKTSLADAMVVTTGRSNRHVSAIADQLIEELKKQGHTHIRVEGQPHCDWVLIDAGDVIVHVFRPEVRSFYNLEKMWSADRPAERIGA